MPISSLSQTGHFQIPRGLRLTEKLDVDIFGYYIISSKNMFIEQLLYVRTCARWLAGDAVFRSFQTIGEGVLNR